MKEMYTNIQSDEKPTAILVGLETAESANFDHSMEEMESLIDACGIEIYAVLTQKLSHPEAGTYLGSGKAEELSELAKNAGVNYCIFEDNLSPAQLKNLQKIVGVPVWDRTTLILEIFSRRARTREARLQVESAYLQYMLPRLSGMWQHLGRQGGGGGSRANKGIGETQLELDRRQINKRIAELKRELESISKTREIQRAGREKGGLFHVALVGYTNAGKSTIMNRLLEYSGGDAEKKVFQENMLFATLDTSTRLISLDGNINFLLSDTVGFIENLPHTLIKAFRSTLEEALSADLLIIVLDVSDEYFRDHLDVTLKTLKDLEAENIPKIICYNKADLLPDEEQNIPKVKENEIRMSAGKGIGLTELLDMIKNAISESCVSFKALIPFSRGELINLLYKNAQILSEEYTAEGVLVSTTCPASIYKQFEDFVV